MHSKKEIIKNSDFVIDDSNKILKTGSGTGAILGGLDQELTWYPVSKTKWEKAQKLQKELDQVDDKISDQTFMVQKPFIVEGLEKLRIRNVDLKAQIRRIAKGIP